MEIKLPSSSLKIIDHYFHLSLGGKKVPCPYYINEDYPLPNSQELAYHYKRSLKRVLVGKGSPQEIEDFTKKIAQKENFDLQKATVKQIREFMAHHEIGIDCSGLVVWALNQVWKEEYGQPIWQFINYGKKHILRKLLIKLRPIENIGVKVLMRNSHEINVEDIKPGDLIITWNDEHVILVTEVGLEYFRYVNSTWWYGDGGGVKEGKVTIKDPQGALLDQDWSEALYKGKNWTYEGLKENGKLMRLSLKMV